jgi:putative spermidine/putrescine transport system permease protein
MKAASNFRIWISLAPVLLVLTGLFAGAIGIALVQSLGHAPIYGVTQFPTIVYYETLLQDPDFWRSLGLTFYYALVPTIVGAIISLFFALILRNQVRGRGLIQYLYKIPMVVPYLVGIGLTILLFSNGGIISRLLFAAGFIDGPADFPRILQSHAGWAVMFVYLWKQIPFMTLVIFSQLIAVGRKEEEAAHILGASPLQALRYITIPRVMPALIGATLIVFAFNFGSFEAPYILSANYPTTLPVEAWKAFDDPDYSRRPLAMAYVMMIVAISGVCLYGYISLYRHMERRGDVS